MLVVTTPRAVVVVVVVVVVGVGVLKPPLVEAVGVIAVAAQSTADVARTLVSVLVVFSVTVE